MVKPLNTRTLMLPFTDKRFCSGVLRIWEKLADAPAVAFAKALAAARAEGWTIIASDPGSGRIEATATTPWFGFRDDVAVRIRPEGRGSRVDVRSVSRIGRGDLGANAKRVRAFAAAVAAPSP